MSKIILPKIKSIKCSGFKPTFSQDITFSLKSGFNIVLGGNGLGKTTMLQATIYALTGGASEEIEEIKSKRWDHRYFSGRISEQYIKGASVEIEFYFGIECVTVRRGFSSSKVVAVKGNTDGDWVTKDADTYFAKLLQDYGGYESLEDFNFVVHKLLYMPESRDLLAWDVGAQVRLLMLLCRDVIDEKEFRDLSAELQFLDSQKRHTHVAIGKAEKEVERLRCESTPHTKPVTVVPQSNNIEDLEKLLKSLETVVKERRASEGKLGGFRTALTTNTVEIEKINEALGDEEAVLIEQSIGKHESGAHLALSKLVENSICPACGSKSIQLQEMAKANVKSCGCVLCGTQTSSKSGAKLATLYSQLTEKNRAQLRLEKNIQGLLYELEQKQVAEYELKKQIDTLRFKDSFILIPKSNSKLGTEKYWLGALAELRLKHAQLEAKGNELGKMLEERYSRFFSTIGARVKSLKDLYSTYSSSFLGVDCELIEHNPKDTFLPLKLFIPSFNSKARFSPESCSEAQRFFLDIAFRLSMIDLASDLSGTKATFICETPETALDLSYEGNVVTMFHGFVKSGQVLLLTANIQHNGLASGMLKKEAQKERAGRTLNLLKYGLLSNVQKGAQKQLEKAVCAIIE